MEDFSDNDSKPVPKPRTLRKQSLVATSTKLGKLLSEHKLAKEQGRAEASPLLAMALRIQARREADPTSERGESIEAIIRQAKEGNAL